MNKLCLALVCLLAISVVQAESYYIVVGETAPVTDVITGANFAASMRASTGVTFRSALDTEIHDELTSFDGKTIAVIDGKNIRVLGSGSVASAAEDYFEGQGFSVERVASPSNSDLLVGPAPQKINAHVDETDAPVAIVDEIEVPDVEEFVPEEIIEIEEYNKELEQAANVTIQETVQSQEPEKPGVFTRVWRWIKGLF